MIIIVRLFLPFTVFLMLSHCVRYNFWYKVVRRGRKGENQLGRQFFHFSQPALTFIIIFREPRLREEESSVVTAG
jgi:hypothetical protein